MSHSKLKFSIEFLRSDCTLSSSCYKICTHKHSLDLEFVYYIFFGSNINSFLKVE